MSLQLDPGVEEIIESPRGELKVHLLVGVSDVEDEEILQGLDTLSESMEPLPRDHLAITTTEADVRDICDLTGVQSIEIDAEVTTLTSRDFRTHLG